MQLPHPPLVLVVRLLPRAVPQGSMQARLRLAAALQPPLPLLVRLLSWAVPQSSMQARLRLAAAMVVLVLVLAWGQCWGQLLVRLRLQPSPRAAAQVQGLRTAPLLALQAPVLLMPALTSPRGLQAAQPAASRAPPRALPTLQALPPQLEALPPLR